MWRSFSRSQIAAFLATIVDYAALVIWVESFHYYYPLGVALGSLFGAVTNFFLNRNWSFEANEGNWQIQAYRYAAVSTGSLLLNTGGVYLVTEFRDVHYLVSKIFISITVGFFWNYPLHRFFVFKKKEPAHEVRIHFATSESKNSSENFDPGTTQSTPA